MASVKGDSRNLAETTGPVLTKVSHVTQAESPSQQRKRSVSGDLGTTVVAELNSYGRQSAQRSDTSFARRAPDAILRNSRSGDNQLVDKTSIPMISQPDLADNQLAFSEKFPVENQVSSQVISKRDRSLSRDHILKTDQSSSRNMIPNRDLASNTNEIYVDEHCSFSDVSSVCGYAKTGQDFNNQAPLNVQTTILEQPISGPNNVSFSVPTRNKQRPLDIDRHSNDKQVITRIVYDKLPVSGHRTFTDEQHSVQVNYIPATGTATDLYQPADTVELPYISHNQYRSTDNRSITGPLLNRPSYTSNVAPGPVPVNRTANQPNYRYTYNPAHDPDVQLQDGNLESYKQGSISRPTNAYGSPVCNRQAYVDRNRVRIHELPSFTASVNQPGKVDRRSMMDEHGRSLMVQRRYIYPNSNAAYSEPPTRVNTHSPPRPQRILDLHDPFEEQFTSRHAGQSGSHQRMTIRKAPVEIPRNSSMPRDESRCRRDESHPDQVSLLAPTHDPLYDSDNEDTRSVEEPHVHNSHSVVLPTSNHPTYDHYEGNDSSENESSVTDPLPDQWSMEKAVNEVFRVLPTTLCPRVPTIPKHKNRSGLEELNNEEVPNQEYLPQANLVRSMLVQLQSTRSEDACSQGWMVPVNIHREAVSARMYNRYAVSLEHFPIKVPSLDSDASSIGLSNPTSINVPTKLLEKWEARSRMGVNVASHSDHFTVTLSQLLKDEKVSSLAIDRIMAALDKSKTALLALNLQNATEMLSLRRDATLDCRSTSLLSGSKDQLRAAPLSANTLFHGKVRAVAAADLAEQTRLCSAHAFSSNRKRPAPSSNFKKFDKGGNHKAKKAKMTPPVKQTVNKSVPYKKTYRGNNQRQKSWGSSATITKTAASVPKARP